MTRTETQQTGRRPVRTAAILGVLIALVSLFLPAAPAAAQESNDDASLSNLSAVSTQYKDDPLQRAVPMWPGFVASTTKYTASIHRDDRYILLRPTAGDSRAAITVAGQSVVSGGTSQAIELSRAQPKSIAVVVTAADGNTEKTYTVTAYRGPSANARITMSRGTLQGDQGVWPSEYTGRVAHNVSSVTLTAETQQTGVVMAVNGTKQTGLTSGPIALQVGENVITVVITAVDGYTTKTHTLRVTRPEAGVEEDAGLSALAVYKTDATLPTRQIGRSSTIAHEATPLTLTPAFDPEVTQYTLTAATDLEQVVVRATTRDGDASLHVDGIRVYTHGEGYGAAEHRPDNGEPSGPWDVDPGLQWVHVRVTAPGGETTRTYTIKIVQGSYQPPTNVQATPAGSGKLLLSWDNPSELPRAFSVVRWREAGTSSWLNEANTLGRRDSHGLGPAGGQVTGAPRRPAPESESYLISGLTDGVEYEVGLQLVQGGQRLHYEGMTYRDDGIGTVEQRPDWLGHDQWATATGTAGEPITPPGAPVGLVLALGNTKLVAGWNPPEDDGGADVTAYEVQYKTTSAPDQAGVFDDPRNGWLDAGHSGTETDTEITGLTNGVGYDVRVRASNSAGDGQWSATASATPHEDVIWSAILTVDNDYGDGTGDFGCVIDVINSSIDDCSAALTEDEFAFGLDTYGWTQFNRSVLPGETASYTKVGLSALTPEDSNLRKGKMQVGSELVSLDDTVRVQWFVPDPDTYRNMQWIYSGFLLHDDPSGGANHWTEGQRVPLSLQARLPQVVVDETPPGLSGSNPDATLSALTVSDGTNDVPLTPAFAADTAGYTASVDNSVDSVTVTPTVNDPNATVTVGGDTVASGSPSSAISLTAGVAEVIDVVVTAQDGTAKTYTVTVTRAAPPMSSDATLSALTVSDGTNDVPLTPEFAAATAGYTASVDNSVDSVTVTPTVNDENATVTVEGSAVTSGKASPALSLAVGVDKDIDIVVTAQNGTAKTYTVTVTRAAPPMSSDATLSALTVSDGTNDVPLTPAFAATTADYTASVDDSVGSVTMTPTVNDPNATVTVEGSAVTSGKASPSLTLPVGTPKAIDVVVTAQDGTVKTYTVTVTREAAVDEAPAPLALPSTTIDLTLSALTVSDGTNDVPLTPGFAADTADYTASVDNSVGSVTLTPTVKDDHATVTVGGSAVTSSMPSPPIALTAGSPEVIEIVVAHGSFTNIYTVTVTRANDTSPSVQIQGSDDDGLIETCRRRYSGDTEGLRVCETPYEGGEAVLMLTLPSPAPANGTTVTIATGDQTAASDDYTMPSTITIGEGETSGIITIAITADGEDEGDETIHIYVCIRPGCDPLNPVAGEKAYNHGIVIPGTRNGGL